MLTSLVLSVRAAQEIDLPRDLGRASHALLLRLIAERTPELAEALHDANGPRAFTCSSLVGGRLDGHVLHLSPEGEAWLRFTGLSTQVSEQLVGLATNPPAMVELDGQSLQVCRATLDAQEHPWAGCDDYRQLCARVLHAAGPPSRTLALEFASPTTFHSRNAAGQRVNVPLPLPHLVFGSLLDRWQAFSPVALDPDVRTYAEQMVVLSRHRLHTRFLRFKEQGGETGFVGEATFAALNSDRYWVRVLQLLAAYAFYAGIGAKTGMGMGQARALPDSQPRA